MRFASAAYLTLRLTISQSKSRLGFYRFGLEITGGPHGIYGTKFLVACTRLYKSPCRSVGLSVGRSVCPTLLLGLKLEKAKKRKRQSVSGNQWEKDEEEDTKKEGNKRHQKEDSVHMKTI